MILTSLKKVENIVAKEEIAQAKYFQTTEVGGGYLLSDRCNYFIFVIMGLHSSREKNHKIIAEQVPELGVGGGMLFVLEICI